MSTKIKTHQKSQQNQTCWRNAIKRELYPKNLKEAVIAKQYKVQQMCQENPALKTTQPYAKRQENK